MKLSVAILFLVSFVTAQSYIFESVDIGKIKTEIINENSDYYYPKLFERYSNNDTTLNLNDYRHLYYGHSLQAYYNPRISRTDDSVITLRKILKSPTPNFKRINELAHFVLRLDPFSIDAIYILSISYEILGDKDKMNLYIDKYTKIIETIIGSGDGKTPETAFTVVSISDEFAFLNAIGLNYKEQALINHNGKYYDLITLENPDLIENDAIYFNIELFFGK